MKDDTSLREWIEELKQHPVLAVVFFMALAFLIVFHLYLKAKGGMKYTNKD